MASSMSQAASSVNCWLLTRTKTTTSTALWASREKPARQPLRETPSSLRNSKWLSLERSIGALSRLILSTNRKQRGTPSTEEVDQLSSKAHILLKVVGAPKCPLTYSCKAIKMERVFKSCPKQTSKSIGPLISPDSERVYVVSTRRNYRENSGLKSNARSLTRINRRV